MAFGVVGSKKTNYAYAVARVQAKRAKLIPESEYEKLLKMDLAEITRYIQESTYKAEVDELATRFSGLDLLESALVINQERTNSSVRRMVDGEGGQLVSLFLMRHLVEDIKSVLRGKNAGAGREELMKELLLEDLDTYGLFQPLLADDVRTPHDVAAALKRQGGIGLQWGKVLESVPSDANLSAFEDALDKALYNHLVRSLEESDQKGSKQMMDFVRREIDAHNIINASRWVAAAQDGDFSPYVIPGGKICKVRDAMALAASDDLGQFADRLGELGLPDDVTEAAKQAAAAKRLTALQAAVTRWHLADIGSLSHQHPLSILPILLFLTRKNREVVTLRALARGKASGLSEERLRELVQ